MIPMFMRNQLATAGTLLIIFSVPALAQTPLHYEPAVVNLSGTVKVEIHYGPPNFGRSPRSDAVQRVPILVLDRPVTVEGSLPRNGERIAVNADTYRNVNRIQLVFVPANRAPAGLDGERVSVSGTLFEKVSGENFTDVLLSVQAVSPGASQAR